MVFWEDRWVVRMGGAGCMDAFSDGCGSVNLLLDARDAKRVTYCTVG